MNLEPHRVAQFDQTQARLDELVENVTAIAMSRANRESATEAGESLGAAITAMTIHEAKDLLSLAIPALAMERYLAAGGA